MLVNQVKTWVVLGGTLTNTEDIIQNMWMVMKIEEDNMVGLNTEVDVNCEVQ